MVGAVADTAGLHSELADTVRDPVRFCRTLLRTELWARQEDILRAIAVPHAKVAVKGCHASAKTHAAARAALWFLTRYADGIVVTTAPKEDQLELMLWKEIRSAIRHSRVKYPEPLTIGVKVSDENYIIGFVAKDAERFQGFHSGHLLFIIEEAPGVGAHIWEAIEGARAGGDVRVLALGNPTIASGPFYDAFTRERAAWTTISISAFDTPNLEGLTPEDIERMTSGEDERLTRNPVPYLASRAWVYEKWQSWGKIDHPLWHARVLGEFPPEAEGQLISLAWLERATNREARDEGGPVTAGVDVAGPGEDETSLVIRQGPRILAEHWWSIADPRGVVAAALLPYRQRLDAVNVDEVGIGYHLCTHLEDLRFPAVGVNVGERCADEANAERFVNLKAQLYWGLRERFQTGDMAGSLSEEAVTQLSGIRYDHDSRGRVRIESKEDARKRGVKSPDRAEALMLAFKSAPEATILATRPGPSRSRMDRAEMPR